MLSPDDWFIHETLCSDLAVELNLILLHHMSSNFVVDALPCAEVPILLHQSFLKGKNNVNERKLKKCYVAKENNRNKFYMQKIM